MYCVCIYISIHPISIIMGVNLYVIKQHSRLTGGASSGGSDPKVNPFSFPMLFRDYSLLGLVRLVRVRSPELPNHHGLYIYVLMYIYMFKYVLIRFNML